MPADPGNAVTPETLFGEGFSRPDLDASRRLWQAQDTAEANERRRLLAQLEYERRKSQF